MVALPRIWQIIQSRLSEKKLDIIQFHTGPNDLTNSVNTMSKVRKIVNVIEEIDGNTEIKLGFSSNIVWKDRDLEKEKDLFLQIVGISRNRKGTNLFSKNIYKSFSSRFE